MEIPKLVTVTRTDIPEGHQAVQSTHAAIDFVFEHPTRAGPWYKNSNTLVMLTVKDVDGLKKLIKKCDYLRLEYTVFREPDMGNEITAICIEPHPETYKMVSKLPLLIPKHNQMNKTTLAIKARLANKLRTQVYQHTKGKHAIPQSMKITLFDEWILDIWAMHIELNNYKDKRKEKAKLLKQRLLAPKTKSMQKKLRTKKERKLLKIQK